jgi:hypothetical protein
MKIEDLGKTLEKAALEAWNDVVDQDGRQIANMFKDDLQKLVRAQSEPWPPLSPRHLQRKQKLGLDQRMLIASGNYLKKIRALRSGIGRWTVEPPDTLMERTKLNPRPRFTYRQLAAVLELGSMIKNIPPRPHWDPMADKYKGRVPEFERSLQKSFNRRLQRKLNKLFSGS